MKHVRAMLAAATLIGSTAAFTGCQTQHRMRASSADKVTVCRECYDKAVEVWDRGGYFSPRWGYVPSGRVYVEHQCAACKSTMAVYTDDGRWMIQCPVCAPKGVPCDKCLPGDGVVQPAPAKGS